MDTALIIITLLSVGLTGALLVYATRLQREQREREEARVLALARDIHEPDAIGREPWRDDSPGPLETGARRDHVIVPDPWPSLETVGDRPIRTEGGHAIDEAPRVTPPAGPVALFGATEEPQSATTPRFLAPLLGVAVVSLVLGGVYFTNARPAVAPAQVSAKAAGPVNGALELVALDQARSGRTLTVRGVVRNPAGASPARGLAAVVFVFDKAGTFLTSARAPIDYQELAPGDESPFTVSVPNVANVARYRVSFRNDHDVVSHVDRRHRDKAGSR